MKGWFTFIFAVAGAAGVTTFMLHRGSATDTWTTWVVIGAAFGAVVGRGIAVAVANIAAKLQAPPRNRSPNQKQPVNAEQIRP